VSDITVLCVAFGILQPLALLVTGNIDKRQYFGIATLYTVVLLASAWMGKS
jgi:hypothetical protein